MNFRGDEFSPDEFSKELLFADFPEFLPIRENKCT